MFKRFRVPLLIGLMLGALVLVGCSSDDDEDGGEATTEATAEASATEAMTETAGGAEGAISVDLTDAWEVSPSAAEAAAGSVTFTANNTGVQPHELVVVKTDLGATELPVEGGVVPEEGEGYEIIGKTAQLAGGASEDLTVDLEAGAYLLICNVPGHYQLGMTTAFTVN